CGNCAAINPLATALAFAASWPYVIVSPSKIIAGRVDSVAASSRTVASGLGFERFMDSGPSLGFMFSPAHPANINAPSQPSQESRIVSLHSDLREFARSRSCADPTCAL